MQTITPDLQKAANEQCTCVGIWLRKLLISLSKSLWHNAAWLKDIAKQAKERQLQPKLLQQLLVYSKARSRGLQTSGCLALLQDDCTPYSLHRLTCAAVYVDYKSQHRLLHKSKTDCRSQHCLHPFIKSLFSVAYVLLPFEDCLSRPGGLPFSSPCNLPPQSKAPCGPSSPHRSSDLASES